MKKIIIGLTLLTSISSFANQPAIDLSTVKLASEQAMDIFTETTGGEKFIEYGIDDVNESIGIKHFSYNNDTGNDAKLVSSYSVVIEERGESATYKCQSDISLTVIGERIFTLKKSSTICEFSHTGDDVYKP